MTTSRYEPATPDDTVGQDGAQPETAREAIGRQVRLWRLRRHVSQAGLAHAAGINQASISNYEAGKRELRVSTLIRIADALNVRIDELLDDETRRTVLHQP
jgi:transcriptional regulator with XRE-family HTH domain